MIVRKIKETELQRTSEIFGIAFEFEVDNEKSAEEATNEVIQSPKGRQDIYFRERWAAFEDDDQTMMAFIVAVPYQIQFDGSLCSMSGIGGVSSLAQYRKHGAIRGCITQMLKDTYQKGDTFSYLYPFSTAYYRKFGYEICSEYVEYTIHLRSISPFSVAGRVALLERGNTLNEIKKVYNDFKKGFNLMVEREDYDYLWAKEANPAKSRVYTYVYYNREDEAKGFMTFTKERAGNPSVTGGGYFDMVCRNFYFSDMEGFQGLLNHCLSFSAYYEHVKFKIPTSINIISYIPEWALYSFDRKLNFNGMVRAVNAKKALELAAYKGSGELVIRLHDSVISENDKTFCVKFSDGKAVSVGESSSEPDIELSIGDFSRFLIGTHSPEELNYVDAARVNCSMEKLGRVFYKKPNFIGDYF